MQVFDLNILCYDNQWYSLLCGLETNEELLIAILQNTEAALGRWGAHSWYKVIQHAKGKWLARQGEIRELVITNAPPA